MGVNTLRIVRKKALVRLVASGSLAAFLALGGLASPASASSSGWEAILGGHLRSASEARRIASDAKSQGFRVYVQRISSNNYEAEIFNGGRSRTQAEAVCARARRVGGLPHCSVEQEMHGNGWG
jgi:hypothetical protein